jgi:uncharacterized protein (UPF0548 family)
MLDRTLFSFRRPPATTLSAVITSQSDAPLTYDLVGRTDAILPRGWVHEEQRILLGHGPQVFTAAKAQLARWAQFDLSWVWPIRDDVPLRVGEAFGFLARHYGIWSINVCRIVYVVDEPDGPLARYGFGYGTVGTHAVRGEERFLLVHDHTTDEVCFEIRKFSLPSSRLLQVLGPFTRWVQRRFTTDALARMQRAVA